MAKQPLDILQLYLADTTVSELMWNGYRSAFAEQGGSIVPIATPFQNEDEFNNVIKSLANLKSTTDGEAFHFDGVLPDGSRYHVTIPPMSPQGPTLTIRKFSKSLRTLESLVQVGFLSEKARIFLDACVKARLNILVSGSTGAGKTTLMNALASRVKMEERIITIEDIPEMQLNHANWVRLLAVRGENEVTVRDCLIGSLRMRPDRILVGECRSQEAVEMLQAMNTGHDGGMTTLHANSPVDALTRLESLVLFHGPSEIPIKALRRQIVDAIDLIVQVRRGSEGLRYIDEIIEVVGMEGEMITRLPLFKRDNSKSPARLLSTGHAPTILAKMQDNGSPLLPKGFFDPQAFER
jgi:pilus assembly protein CpaF